MAVAIDDADATATGPEVVRRTRVVVDHSVGVSFRHQCHGFNELSTVPIRQGRTVIFRGP